MALTSTDRATNRRKTFRGQYEGLEKKKSKTGPWFFSSAHKTRKELGGLTLDQADILIKASASLADTLLPLALCDPTNNPGKSPQVTLLTPNEAHKHSEAREALESETIDLKDKLGGDLFDELAATSPSVISIDEPTHLNVANALIRAINDNAQAMHGLSEKINSINLNTDESVRKYIDELLKLDETNLGTFYPKTLTLSSSSTTSRGASIKEHLTKLKGNIGDIESGEKKRLADAMIKKWEAEQKSLLERHRTLAESFEIIAEPLRTFSSHYENQGPAFYMQAPLTSQNPSTGGITQRHFDQATKKWIDDEPVMVKISDGQGGTIDVPLKLSNAAFQKLADDYNLEHPNDDPLKVTNVKSWKSWLGMENRTVNQIIKHSSREQQQSFQEFLAKHGKKYMEPSETVRADNIKGGSSQIDGATEEEKAEGFIGGEGEEETRGIRLGGDT